MAIANFNPEEFGKNLADQATELVPKELGNNREYVINKVYEFCVLAGNALNQDNALHLSADQAYLICRFIGEWTFHKSIDVVRANIPVEFRDGILQQVAFAIFETAKQTQINKLDQNQAVIQVENAVKENYEKCLRELAQGGKLGNSNVDQILKISNLEQMAKAQYQQNQQEKQKQNKAAPQNDKLTRLASIALLLKSFPKEKANKILSNLDSNTANTVRTFMNQANLEKQLDPNIASKYLNSLSQSVFSLTRSSAIPKNEHIKNLTSLYSKNEILGILKNERIFLTKYVKFCINDEPTDLDNPLTTYVSNIIYLHLKQQLAKINS